MSKYVIDGATLSAIADSIRAKKGTTANINPENMPAEIVSIETGEYEIWTITYTDGTIEEKKVVVL